MNSFARNVVLVCCWASIVGYGSFVIHFTGSSSPDWSTVEVNNMTHEELVDYIRFTNASNCKLERDFGGNVDGNKSVCLDPEIRPEPGNCFVYSFGVHHEWTLDEEMAKYGCQVYAFDPMIKQSHNRSDRIHVYNYGLSYKSEISVQNWTVFPLNKIYMMLQPAHGRVPISYLRFDLEDFDLRVLSNIIRTGGLLDIRQLSLEVHIEPEGTLDQLRDTVEILRGLEALGFVRFASNGIPSSYDYLQPIDFEGYLDYDISWYNSNLVSHNFEK